MWKKVTNLETYLLVYKSFIILVYLRIKKNSYAVKIMNIIWGYIYI